MSPKPRTQADPKPHPKLVIRPHPVWYTLHTDLHKPDLHPLYRPLPKCLPVETTSGLDQSMDDEWSLFGIWTAKVGAEDAVRMGRLGWIEMPSRRLGDPRSDPLVGRSKRKHWKGCILLRWEIEWGTEQDSRSCIKFCLILHRAP